MCRCDAVPSDACRMGKGKGPFSYYHCRVSVGKVVVEIGSPDTSIEPELAKRSACLSLQRV